MTNPQCMICQGLCCGEIPRLQAQSVANFNEAVKNREEVLQLRGNLSLAEEGLANAMQEIERLQGVIATREEALRALTRELPPLPGNEPNEQLVTTDYGPALLAICKWSGCTSTMAEGDPYFCPTHRQLARRNAEESECAHVWLDVQKDSMRAYQQCSECGDTRETR